MSRLEKQSLDKLEVVFHICSSVAIQGETAGLPGSVKAVPPPAAAVRFLIDRSGECGG